MKNMHSRFSARYVLTVASWLFLSDTNVDTYMSYHVLQASTLGMVPPTYAWITYGWYQELFWKQNRSNGTSYQHVFDQCSREQIMNIINQMILIHNYPRYDERDRGNPIIGNLVRSNIVQYKRELGAKCTGPY